MSNIKRINKKNVMTLDDLLRDIDVEVSSGDLKELVVQYVLETPDDPTDQKGYRARLRLEGLRLLSELVKLESKSNSTDASILQLINNKDNE